MVKYVDADKVLKNLPDDLPYKASVKRVLMSAPTADVAEVRHGRWKRVRWVKCDDPDGGYWIVRCNQCSIPHFKEYNFCPSCGARMDGDEE
jgi:hypothetical protein